jgi:hypothetical protein
MSLESGQVENALQNLISLFSKKQDGVDCKLMQNYLIEFEKLILQHSLFEHDFKLDLPILENDYIQVILSDRFNLLSSVTPSIWANGMFLSIS